MSTLYGNVWPVSITYCRRAMMWPGALLLPPPPAGRSTSPTDPSSGYCSSELLPSDSDDALMTSLPSTGHHDKVTIVCDKTKIQHLKKAHDQVFFSGEITAAQLTNSPSFTEVVLLRCLPAPGRLLTAPSPASTPPPAPPRLARQSLLLERFFSKHAMYLVIISTIDLVEKRMHIIKHKRHNRKQINTFCATSVARFGATVSGTDVIGGDLLTRLVFIRHGAVRHFLSSGHDFLHLLLDTLQNLVRRQ